MKLSKADMQKVLELYEDGTPVKNLAEKFNCSPKYISNLVYRKRAEQIPAELWAEWEVMRMYVLEGLRNGLHLS